eukprot:6214558-Pleurochrysis_carterae.AAC.1
MDLYDDIPTQTEISQVQYSHQAAGSSMRKQQRTQGRRKNAKLNRRSKGLWVWERGKRSQTGRAP